MYNQLYAPHYAAEDKTNIEQEAARIQEYLMHAIEAAAKREDIGDWLRLGGQSISAAFENYRKGDAHRARKNIEAALEYLRNASSEEPPKADFIAKLDGTIKRVN